MSGLAIAGIVVGIVAGLLVIGGILAAIAIPVFLNQKEKAEDAGARISATNIAIAIQYYLVDHPGTTPLITSTANGALVTTPDGQLVHDVMFENGVSFGGLVAYNSGEWCVWVTTGHASANYHSSGGLGDGACP